MYFLNKTINGIRLYYLVILGILYFSFHQSSAYFLFFTNTVLAYIPIELTFLSLYYKRKYIIVVIICVWLVYLPNNFYLITDLFHISLLTPYDEYTMLISKDFMNWSKLCLIYLSVFPTIFFGCWSIDKISGILVEELGIEGFKTFLIACILFVDSIGIYIGRFSRLNSIDIIVNFKQTISRIFIELEKIDNRSISIVILLYLFLCSIMAGYYLIKILINKKWEESVDNNGYSNSRG